MLSYTGRIFCLYSAYTAIILKVVKKKILLQYCLIQVLYFAYTALILKVDIKYSSYTVL